MVAASNLAVRFVLELCALLALGYWGFRTGSGAFRIVLGLGAPILLATAWGLFGSPRAAVPLPVPTKLLFELIVFGVAVLALAFAGRPTLAWAFAAIVVVNRILMIAWRQ